MKKFFTLSLLLASALAANANLDGNGYYRVQNYKTLRYCSVIDNRGSIDLVATSADLQAIKLWKLFEDVSHDPASIFYISKVGSEYQLTTQGTGVYQIIDHYLNLRANGSANGQTLYMAYGTYNNVTKYLADANSWSGNRGSMGTNSSGDYRKWYILPVKADSNDYFGAYPDVDADGSLYCSLYASFPFSAYSDGVKFYYVSNVASTGIVELTEIEGTVPAATPVVVECAGLSPADNKFNVGGTGAAVNGNLLKGQYFNCDVDGHINRVAYNPTNMRILGRCKDGSLGFVKASIDYIPANTAYLTVPGWYPDELKCVKTHDEFTSGVEDIEAVEEASAPKTVYTMTGVMLYQDASDDEINSLPAGMYIIGGKKVIIKN